jgi:hypothetical protein
MTLFLPFRKAALLIPTPPHGEHLFVLLTDPVGEEREVLLASLSTAHPRCDRSCILVPGDHPFIKRASYVAYSMARIEPADRLLRGVAESVFLVREPVSDKTMAYIIRGLLESRHTTAIVKRFYQMSLPVLP